VSEFNLSADGNSPEAAKLLPFANQVTTWALPNGAVSATNYVAADSQEVAYATWYSGEWNPGALAADPSGTKLRAARFGEHHHREFGRGREYLALYPGPNTSGNITYGWGRSSSTSMEGLPTGCKWDLAS